MRQVDDMGKKDRCYLCGAKLHNGYCKDCGFDNQRSQKIRYRLNESEKTQKHKKTQQNIKVKTNPTIYRGKAGKGFQLDKIKRIENNKIKRVENKKSAGGKIAVFILLGIGCVMIISLVSVGIELYHSYEVQESDVTVEYTDEPVDGYYNPDEWEGSEPSGKLVLTERSDSYEFVERELNPQGEGYVSYIEYGEYIVGSQIPEGTYTIRLKEGNGYVNIDDVENSIYLWQDFGTNTEYDEILVWQDVRLYEGAIVQVSDNMQLEFESENAQMEDLKMMENPLGQEETFLLEEGETLVAGEDFEPGVYDTAISSTDGWGLLYIKTTTTDPYAEDGYFENQIWLEDYNVGNCYHNLYIPEGSEIYIESFDPVVFIPSEEIADIDYTDYYEKYY